MDEIKTPTSTTGSSSSDLSIKILIKDSWDISLKTILRFIVIGVISLVLGLALLIIGGIAVSSMLGSIVGFDRLVEIFKAQDSMAFLEIITNPQIQTTGGIILAVYILLSFILQALIAIAIIMAISTAGQPFNLSIVLQKAKKVLFPYILLQILLGFLFVGSMFFFILPFLLVMFLLIFANYELILSEQSAFNALKRSVYLVTKNFGHVFVAILILLGLQLVFQSLPGLLGQILSDESYAGVFFIFFIFYLVLSFIFSWFTTVFMIVMYKQVSGITDKEGKGHVWWMWIVALLGWLLLIGIIFYGFRFINAMIAKSTPPEIPMSEYLTYVPSSCGLEAGLPVTTDNFEGAERKWMFEEYPADRSGFPLLDEQTVPSDDAQATLIIYKDPDESANDEASGLLNIYPGLDIRCTDNPRGLDMETFAGLLTTNKDIKMEIVNENAFESDSGVELKFFNILYTDDEGNELEDPGYIGVSQDGSKLIYINYYDALEKDQLKDQIDLDINQIFRSLRYGAVSTVPEPETATTVSNTQPAPAAPQPTIKPGELGSQEWIDNFNKEYAETKQKIEESR